MSAAFDEQGIILKQRDLFINLQQDVVISGPLSTINRMVLQAPAAAVAAGNETKFVIYISCLPTPCLNLAQSRYWWSVRYSRAFFFLPVPACLAEMEPTNARMHAVHVTCILTTILKIICMPSTQTHIISYIMSVSWEKAQYNQG